MYVQSDKNRSEILRGNLRYWSWSVIILYVSKIDFAHLLANNKNTHFWIDTTEKLENSKIDITLMSKYI